MCSCMRLPNLLTISDVLREADPTLLLYSPSSASGEREGVLKALVPELDSGIFRLLVDYTPVRLATMVEPLKSRQFRNLQALLYQQVGHFTAHFHVLSLPF